MQSIGNRGAGRTGNFFRSFMSSFTQCRRLASTRRTKADWFANGPTAQSSCWPGCPTTLLGGKCGGRGRGLEGCALRT